MSPGLGNYGQALDLFLACQIGHKRCVGAQTKRPRLYDHEQMRKGTRWFRKLDSSELTVLASAPVKAATVNQLLIVF
jgi:hypothetical protein